MAKCANCGTEMLNMYTKQGLKVLMCGHIEANHVKNISGIIKRVEVHCKIDIQGLRATFETLTKNSKLTLEALRKATKQTISDAQLLESANLAIMLGLPTDQLAELFEASTKLGYGLGIPTTKAIEALCKGVGRRSRMILDNIGIVFKAKEAYDAYPDIDKKEAWQKYAIKLIKEKAKVIGA